MARASCLLGDSDDDDDDGSGDYDEDTDDESFTGGFFASLRQSPRGMFATPRALRDIPEAPECLADASGVEDVVEYLV